VQYATRLVGNVSDRWTKKGREREMEQLSQAVTANAQDGWRLHSLQPVTIYGGMSGKPPRNAVARRLREGVDPLGRLSNHLTS
jgi:hypothetical protein